jgi:DNA-binding CsgD family transcriptional regulator
VLSAQQLQIAALAAQGKRNHEIADELQLSPRTVSSHLHNAYLRLGITRRDELRRALAEYPTRWASDGMGIRGGDRQ